MRGQMSRKRGVMKWIVYIVHMRVHMYTPSDGFGAFTSGADAWRADDSFSRPALAGVRPFKAAIDLPYNLPTNDII